MTNKPSKYAETGVDTRKTGIEVFKRNVNNLFPQAFCVISEDPDLPRSGLVTHSDGAGSKPVQSYLNWRETASIDSFKYLAQDVLAMNLDDIICVGARPINFVDYVAINPFRVPKPEFLDALNSGFRDCLNLLEKEGARILFSGGETADQPDQVRTLDVSGTMNGRVEMSKIISGDKIKSGDVIIGLRSGGRTKYESKQNSGIMCNGLTLARLCLMRREYQEKYPEIICSCGRNYYGRFKVTDFLEDLGMTVGEALTCPTRFFAPVIRKILSEHHQDISGLVHNTGGGLTKCLRLGRNIHYFKERLFKPDPIFSLIQKESSEEWRFMMENYNMGTGFEIITENETVDDIIEIAEAFRLESEVVGRCEKSDGKNRLTIKSPYGKFQYE